jgi:4-hydroxyphenylpyruvate dioxygenase-like putative hemolysin
MSIREALQQRLEGEDNQLVKYVIEDILEQDEDYMQSYMEDVQRHGCISGMVGSLIYYGDTHAFYDKYYDEIEDLRQDMLEQGIDFLEYIKENDFKNHMAWMAYEETMRQVSEELEVYA